MRQIRQSLQAVLSAADFPAEILTGVPVVEIKGTTEAEVIHHRGILRYEPNEIHVASSIGAVRIIGENMTIVRMNRERIVLRGRVFQVSVGGAQEC